MGIWANTKTAASKDIKGWLKQASLSKYFDCIVTSVEIGYRKPDKEFFHRALEKCRINKKEVVYGIISIFLSGQSYKSLDDDTSLRNIVKPSYTIKNLKELPNLLDTI